MELLEKAKLAWSISKEAIFDLKIGPNNLYF